MMMIPFYKIKIYKTKSRSSGGFSLIEVLVAIVIFSVVMLIAIGALVSIIDLNRKARSQKQALNNLNSALESMTRTIRDGTNYYCDYSANPATYDFEKDISAGNPCPLGPPDANVFVFDSFLTRTAYFEFGGQIMRYKNGVSVAMTAPDVSIEDLSFRTIVYTDSVTIPTAQPNVLITVRGRAGINDPTTETVFSLQSTVSERLHPASSPGGGTPTPLNNPHCTFPMKSGRYIVNFEADKVAFGYAALHRGKPITHPHSSLSYNLDSSEDNRDPIEGGKTYKVTFASYDNHWNDDEMNWGCTEPGSDEYTCVGNPGHAQPNEEMYMEFYQGGTLVAGGAQPPLSTKGSGTYFSLKDITDDVPWNQNDWQTIMGEIDIPAGGIDAIRIVHAHTLPPWGDGSYTGPAQSVVPACAAFDDISEVDSVIIQEF
jgi:prepilin-type N-terminal cleavage/methylation domain-containing protein